MRLRILVPSGENVQFAIGFVLFLFPFFIVVTAANGRDDSLL